MGSRRMWYGKYKGIPISRIISFNPKYMDWMVQNTGLELTDAEAQYLKDKLSKHSDRTKTEEKIDMKKDSMYTKETNDVAPFSFELTHIPNSICDVTSYAVNDITITEPEISISLEDMRKEYIRYKEYERNNSFNALFDL